MSKEILKEAFNLKADQATNEEIRQRIHEGANISGSNMYILIFSILIASIGLNMNSTAVVIGAMLISPLMNVILDLAYGIATQNSETIKDSFYKFILQFAISILTSTIYFFLSPMNTFSGELLARTQPTFWDALIAFFGGFAAVIANTRKSTVSNVIPGAAIATALMPPLCTVGFCIANAEWMSALGALYLFVINVIFICLSSILGLYIMKATDSKALVRTKKDRLVLFVIIAVAIIPSSILAWESVQQTIDERQYHAFVKEEFEFDNTQVLKSSISTEDKTIEVVLFGEELDSKELKEIHKDAKEYGLDKYELKISQTRIDNGISRSEIDELFGTEEDPGILTDMGKELESTKKLLDLQNKTIDLQKATADEILLLYPKVKSAGFTTLSYIKEEPKDNEGVTTESTAKDGQFALVLVVDEKLRDEEEANLNTWLKTKFEKPVVIIQHEK